MNAKKRKTKTQNKTKQNMNKKQTIMFLLRLRRRLIKLNGFKSVITKPKTGFIYLHLVNIIRW